MKSIVVLALIALFALLPSSVHARDIDPCQEAVWFSVNNHLVYVSREVTTSPIARNQAMGWYVIQRSQYPVGTPIWRMFNDSWFAGKQAEAEWPEGVTCPGNDESDSGNPVTHTPHAPPPATHTPDTPTNPPSDPPPAPEPDPEHGGGQNHDPQPNHGNEGEHGNGSPHGG